MPGYLYLSYSFAVGAGLGILYFGGLWVTVKSLPNARYPSLLSLGSYLGRIGMLLLGFYLVMDQHWMPLLVCMVGFLVTRLWMVRHLGETGGVSDDHQS